MGGLCRQVEVEGRACPKLAFNGNIAAMRPDNASRDGQPQAGSTRAAVAGFLTPVETVKDVRQVFRADALAGVRYCDMDF